MHRCWWDRDWVPDPVRDTQWTRMDYMLIKAYGIIQDFTDSNGQLLWLSESSRVYWDTDSRINNAGAAVQRATEARKKLLPGEQIFATNPHVNAGEELPTMMDWLMDLERGEAGKESGAPEGGRPPTAEEIAEMRRKRLIVAEGGSVE